MKKILYFLLLSVWSLQSTFQLSSPDVEPDKPISARFTCDGKNFSPTLTWKDVPPKTVSFVIIVNDPDAPNKNWVHWAVFNIPAKINTLAERADLSRFTVGLNSFLQTNYQGPCPPRGDPPHHYHFTLYALDRKLNLPKGSRADKILTRIQPYILAKSELVGTYQRMLD